MNTQAIREEELDEALVVQPARELPLWRELFAGFDWISLRTSPVFFGFELPQGEGCPVVVVPGLFGSDAYLVELHRWLERVGYRPYYSEIGTNIECPRVAVERLLREGSLLFLRTGSGARHAEKVGADQLRDGLDDEVRSVLFWVNLARKDKASEPYAIVLHREDMALTQEGDATHRILVGDGSTVQLGTPGLILDVELARGGRTSHNVPAEFQGFAYLLDGAASFGANRAQAQAGQLALMGSGESFAVEDATPGTRYLLMAGKPYGEEPRFNGPFVD